MNQLLRGIKIIDFTRLLPGPLATHILAQMGAEVIKIEHPKRGDYAKITGPQIDGASALYHQLNHNKAVLTIDYNTPSGKQKILDLIQSADVLIEQFRPSAMDAWGLGYNDVKKVKPDLIYTSVTGYGKNNKYSQEAGHDLNYLAYSGVLSLIKDDTGKPVVPGTQFADIGGAYMTIIALQSAIINKMTTRKGCHISVPLSQSINPFLTLPMSIEAGNLPHETFNFLNGKVAVNYMVFECADGKWIALAPVEMKFWNNFCEAIKHPEWKTNNPMNLFIQNFDKIQLEQLFKTKNRDEWVQFFSKKDVCIAPVLELSELAHSDFHQENQTFKTIMTPNGQKLIGITLPFSVEE